MTIIKKQTNEDILESYRSVTKELIKATEDMKAKNEKTKDG